MPKIAEVTTVADQVRTLAAQHKIAYRASKLDRWADAVTRLAGDEVEFDDTQRLIVELARAEIISEIEMLRLIQRHHRDINGGH